MERLFALEALQEGKHFCFASSVSKKITSILILNNVYTQSIRDEMYCVS